MYKTRALCRPSRTSFARSEIRKALGHNRPDTGDSLSGIAELNHAKACMQMRSLSSAQTESVSNIELNVATGSEQQRLLYLATLTTETYRHLCTYNLCQMMRSPPRSPYSATTERPSIMRRSTASAFYAAASTMGPLSAGRVTGARARLSKLVLAGPGSGGCSAPGRDQES